MSTYSAPKLLSIRVSVAGNFQLLHPFDRRIWFRFELESTPVVIFSQSGLTRLPQQILSESATRNSIIVEDHATLPQDRDQEIHYIFEAAWIRDIGNDRAVDICFVDPLWKQVSEASHATMITS